MSVIHPGCAGQTPYPNFHTKKNIIYSQLNGKTNKLYSFVGASYVIHIGGARRQDAAWHQSPLEKNPTERTVIQHLSKSTALWWVTSTCTGTRVRGGGEAEAICHAPPQVNVKYFPCFGVCVFVCTHLLIREYPVRCIVHEHTSTQVVLL